MQQIDLNSYLEDKVYLTGYNFTLADILLYYGLHRFIVSIWIVIGVFACDVQNDLFCLEFKSSLNFQLITWKWKELFLYKVPYANVPSMHPSHIGASCSLTCLIPVLVPVFLWGSFSCHPLYSLVILTWTPPSPFCSSSTPRFQYCTFCAISYPSS